MRLALIALAAITAAGLATPAFAACGDATALGISRTVSVDPTGGFAVGSMQRYRGSLGLEPGEVVLTFDDGPMPGRTDKVLDALDAACVKATFFVVGRMARAYPDLLAREAAEGETIGTHSWSHPTTLARLSYDAGARQIDRGIAAIAALLGHAPAPFFRFPGFGDSRALRQKLNDQGIAIFGADVVGSDWTGISADAIRRNVLRRLKQHNGGIVMLHDIKKATAKMLPQLLADLKLAGYRIVAIVPTAPVAAL
ncbi:MAG TPA: polysaccharide deacetylase family protein [Bauldia sp.]|nr:polysaccharide deacetylase family protein [Bauldia sp.]